MKKIAVLGSSGFIAGHTIEHLHELGFEVIGLARHTGYLVDTPEKARPDYVYYGDIRDKEIVERVVSLSDGVINLAGILGTQETVQNPFPSVEVNIFGALNVLEACKVWKVPMVQIAVGNYFEKNSYSMTKTCAEGFCQMYARHNGVKVNVVRALNAFGSRQKSYPVRKIVPSFITRALNHEPIQIYGDGEQLMDMVAVEDVAKVLVDVLINKTTYGTVYEVGTGVGLKVKDIAQAVIDLSGSKSVIEYLPMRPGETRGVAVIAKDPYPIVYRDFTQALAETINWYKANEKIWKK